MRSSSLLQIFAMKARVQLIKHAAMVAILSLLVIRLSGQIVTGSISGTVVDGNGGSIAKADLTLKHARTGLALQTPTDESGRFVFPSLEPGEYTLTVEKAGFKKFEQKGIALQTGERLALGTVALTLGAVTETVSVTAETERVKTESSERSGNITSTQVDKLLLLGRNVTSLVSLLPGVAEDLGASNAASLSRDGGSFYAQGGRSTQNNVQLDGINSTDSDNGGAAKLQTSADAIAEVTVLLNGYQAEYAAGSGAIVLQVAKSGTRDFHGGASWYVKDEHFNANNFFNNRNGTKRPRDHTNNWNYSIGGPILLGKLNRNRDKLFFFWNQEFWPNRNGNVVTRTVPTDLERTGDFSQSLDVNGALRVIRDPITGSPFPGNTIPANRLDPNGQKILNLFPKANFFNTAVSNRQYNYLVSAPSSNPNSTSLLKVDYNLSNKDRLYATWARFHEVSEGFAGTASYFGGTWPFATMRFDARTQGLGTRWTRTFSATTVNELGFSWEGNPETGDPFTQQDAAKLLRSTYNLQLPTLFNLKGNPNGYLPVTNFGGVPNAARTGDGGGYTLLPYWGPNNLYRWTDKLSVLRGSHWFKAGIEVMRYWRDFGATVAQFGSYDFGVNALNPLDSNYAYSNAILGIFNQYQETNGNPRQYARGGDYDWFVQDTWKATSRLTLDYGIRFLYFIPTYSADNAWAAFLPSAYDPSKAVTLYQPGTNASGARAAVNPLTGQTFPQALIGAIVPNTGVIFGGMVSPLTNSNISRGAYNNPGIQYSPRFGFAWDVFGDHKTSVRGGGGLFYSPSPLNQWRSRVANPPLVQTPTLLYGTFANLANATSATFPTGVGGLDPTPKMPMSMNFNIGVQRDIGFGTIVDVAYVGSLGRHLLRSRNLNAVPFGANFLPANQDPTTGRAKISNLLRPIPGYGDINILENVGTSHYNSLQVAVNRRMGKSLTYGAAYTLSKSMDFGSSEQSGVSNLVPLRQWNYGLSDFDQTHTLKLNWLWNLPNSSRRNLAVKLVLNDWQVSGIASFVSGRPAGVGFSTTTPIDITGSPTDGARLLLAGDPTLPKGDRTFERNFRTEAFSFPAVGTYGGFGDAGRSPLRQPGINNWNVAFFKTVPFGEKIRLQIRSEMYNFFNHTQFAAFNTTARFDPATRQQIDPTFGQYVSARNPRRMQFGARISF